MTETKQIMSFVLGTRVKMCLFRVQALQEAPLTSLKVSYRRSIGNNDEPWGVTDVGLKYLRGMPLTFLDLSGNGCLTGASFQCLSKLPLKTLKLQRCRRLIGTNLAHLYNLPLKMVSFLGCWLADEAKASLKEALEVRSLCFLCLKM